MFIRHKVKNNNYILEKLKNTLTRWPKLTSPMRSRHSVPPDVMLWWQYHRCSIPRMPNLNLMQKPQMRNFLLKRGGEQKTAFSKNMSYQCHKRQRGSWKWSRVEGTWGQMNNQMIKTKMVRFKKQGNLGKRCISVLCISLNSCQFSVNFKSFPHRKLKKN